MNKRGQFFILTAVILSVLLFSLAFTVNEVVSIERQNRFYDYSGDVEREAKNIIDYQVYGGFETATELDEFVTLLETDFRDKAVDSNFMVIYGNEDSLTIKNLGTSGITVDIDDESKDDELLHGSSESLTSNIRIGGITSVDAENFRSEDTSIRYYTQSYVDQIQNECAFSFCEQAYHQAYNDDTKTYDNKIVRLFDEADIDYTDNGGVFVNDQVIPHKRIPFNSYFCDGGDGISQDFLEGEGSEADGVPGILEIPNLRVTLDSTNIQEPLSKDDYIKICLNDEFGFEDKDFNYIRSSAPSSQDTIKEFFNEDGKITIEFNDYSYEFEITESNQVIFIIQRDIDDETYVDVR